MTDTCPVNDAVVFVKEQLDTNRLIHPKMRRIGEEIFTLLSDIAWGRAGQEHLPAIESLSKKLIDFQPDSAASEVGTRIASALSEHHETFQSHVDTRNCFRGACVKLTPAPCQLACPAGIDIPSYLSLIGMGKDAEAIELIRKDNPFPWVCGLICTHPCEFKCVRGKIDRPVSIKFLKAFSAEMALSEHQYKNPPKDADKEKKVAIIGAGPGGLSAAYYLALKGYQVRVIEALPLAGGMMMVGIPSYRLPREVIDQEVQRIEDLGVEFRFNTKFGKDITLEDLKAEGFEAFFFAIGAHTSFKLDIPGEHNYPQVIEAIDFLKRVALGGRKSPGKKVIVIGGGNVAIDAARTALRLGCEDVIIAYRRTRNEMPADPEEVDQAEEEGVRFNFLTIPTAIIGNNGNLTGVNCLKAELVQQPGSKRKFPVPINGSDHIIEADAVISAIGQKVDSDTMMSIANLTWSRRSTIEVNRVSMETSVLGIFAAGDAVTGPATVIEAIGGGKRAAEAIDRYLQGIPQPKLPQVPVRRGQIDCLKVPAGTKMVLNRPEMPMLNIERRRTTFQQVELGYSENAVREEARRCLRCDICRRCGECVKICRDKMGINALQLGYMDVEHPTDFRTTAERCIACGACAVNCTNQAMRIEDIRGERILSLCGTILNRQKLIPCSECGAPVGTSRYLNYVQNRIQHIEKKVNNRILCETCVRKITASYLDSIGTSILTLGI